jgi:hypothetical protein
MVPLQGLLLGADVLDRPQFISSTVIFRSADQTRSAFLWSFSEDELGSEASSDIVNKPADLEDRQRRPTSTCPDDW